MRITIALDNNGCEIISKEYRVNSTLKALELFENYIVKKGIKYNDIIVKRG